MICRLGRSVRRSGLGPTVSLRRREERDSCGSFRSCPPFVDWQLHLHRERVGQRLLPYLRSWPEERHSLALEAEVEGRQLTEEAVVEVVLRRPKMEVAIEMSDPIGLVVGLLERRCHSDCSRSRP